MSTQRFIAKVTYVAKRRKHIQYVKMPYGESFSMTEVLTRAWSLGLITWFRIDTIKAGELTHELRAELTRWPDALAPVVEAIA